MAAGDASANESGTTSGPAGNRRAQIGMMQAVLIGLGAGLVGSFLIGAIEGAMITFSVSRDLQGESVPLEYVLAVIGRNGVTHALVWCPLLAILSLGRWTIAAQRRSAIGGAVFAFAGFVALAGTVVVYAWLEITHRSGLTWLALSAVSACVCATLLFLGLTWLCRRVGEKVARQGLWVAAGITVVSLFGTAAVFARSPLCNPAAWRASVAGRADHHSGGPSHVLWIVWDTARADRTSLHGWSAPTTPYLEQLAAQSLVYDCAIANGMWTLPTHASMFTGLSVRAHGACRTNLWLDEEFVTVADCLDAAGYETCVFSVNPLVSPDTNLAQGFAQWWGVSELKNLSRFSLAWLSQRWGLTPWLPWFDQDYGAALTNDLVGDWLDERVNRPVFVFMNLMEAHLPYQVPQRYREMYLTPAQVSRSYELAFSAFGNLSTRLDMDYNISGSDFLSDADREVLRGQYAAAIRYLDDRLRETIQLFESRGLLENTLVIITADHGEYLGEHGMWAHRFQTYQELIHVPLLVRPPGRAAAWRQAKPVQLSDLFATITTAVVPQPPTEPPPGSRDLLRIEPDADVQRIAVSEFDGPAPQSLHRFKRVTDPIILERKQRQIAAVDERYKLIRTEDGRHELYDLLSDPQETTNLAESVPREVDRLGAFLDQWLAETPKYKPPATDAGKVTERLMRSMRQLGYLGADDGYAVEEKDDPDSD